MKTRNKGEKMKICQTYKNAHTELFCMCFQENRIYIYMLIYTPVEITYNVFLSDLLLFTTKELFPDSVTAPMLTNTKELQGTMFYTLAKIHRGKETV